MADKTKMADKTNLERAREAWASLPYNAKSIVFTEFGDSVQNVNHILTHGRKDEKIIIRLLECIKTASEKAAAEVIQQNEIVQAI